MFDNLLKIYDAFQKSEVRDPLVETLKLVDILSNRTVDRIDALIPTMADFDAADLAEKRKEGTPMEYILGKAPFLGEMFCCSPKTLIPREETELLARIALNFVREKEKTIDEPLAIDMGTGCGNIAVSLALNSERTKILASDLYPETIETTQKNVDAFQLRDRISLFNGDLFAPFAGLDIQGKIDVIVCNPPYIPTGSLKNLDSEIIDHEPREAFDAGPFGIDFFRRLVNDSVALLKPEGILVFEIGVGQEKLVERLFKKNQNYRQIDYHRRGTEIRVVSAVRSSDT